MKWYDSLIAMAIGIAACVCVIYGRDFSPLSVLGGFLATINYFVGKAIN